MHLPAILGIIYVDALEDYGGISIAGVPTTVAKRENWGLVVDKIIEFLENRGFVIDKSDDKFQIRIGHRHAGRGNEKKIFVDYDELEAIEQLGNLVKIEYSNEVLILKIMA